MCILFPIKYKKRKDPKVAMSSSSSSMTSCMTNSISSLGPQWLVFNYARRLIKCHCKDEEKAAMWTSWSNDNTGMKFFSCSTGKFFKWHDNEIRGRAWDMIVCLRDRKRELDAKNKQLKLRVKEISCEWTQVRNCYNEQKEELIMETKALSTKKKWNVIVLVSFRCFYYNEK